MTPIPWLIGIDDTDNLESIGTGRLSRMLAEHLVAEGLLEDTSVTRHQFLVHPDIPYTSHNSSACIAGHGPASAGALLAAAREFLLANFHEGANPGLFVSAPDDVPEVLVALAKSAQQQVLTLDGFDGAVVGHGLQLWWGGETGQGRIGAASGVALRSTGEDGRFIALPGIRDLAGVLPVSEIVSRSGIGAVEARDGTRLAPDVAVDTRDWVRPTLRGGIPVFVVRREGDAWIPAERRAKEG